MPDAKGHEKDLIEVIAGACGFTLPIRLGTEQAVQKIYQPIINAVLAAGWEPSGTQALYENAERERRALKAVLADAEAVAKTWDERGFGVANGATYAAELRAIIHKEDR